MMEIVEIPIHLIGNHSRKQFSCKGENTISGIFFMILIQDMVDNTEYIKEFGSRNAEGGNRRPI
jgi:hypothetical protein